MRFLSFAGRWCRVGWPIVLMLAPGGRAAEGGIHRVAVENVSFDTPRSPVDGEPWHEAEIRLAVSPDAPDGPYVARVRVILSLGFERTTGGARSFAFFRSSAELVALESGARKVRFYLPLEAIKSETLRVPPRYYLVEVEAAGKPQALARGAFSAGSLTHASALDSFKERMAAEASANEGILVPQYESPFAFDPARPTPAFVRR